MAIERHDFRSPTRDKFGKPGVTYPWGSTNFPRIVEARSARKGTKEATLNPFYTPHRDQASYPGAVLTDQKSTVGDDTDKNITEIYEILPGAVITEFNEHTRSGIPIAIARQRVAATTIYSQLGLFQPDTINVKGITTGTTVTVTLAGDHGMPPGAFVVFSGTNSTPAIDGTLQILGVTATNQVTVKPESPVTVAGTTAGTFVSKYPMVRELKVTDTPAVKMKVESVVATSDVSQFNEDILCEHPWPYPSFIKSFRFYIDSATSSTGFAGTSTSARWGGAPSFPEQKGYRGMSRCRRRRFFYVGAPPDSFAQQFMPTVIAPSSGSIAIKGGSLEKSIPLGGTLSDISFASSNTWRTANTPEGLTGPSPSITFMGINGQPLPVIAITSIAISGGYSGSTPGITTATAHGRSNGDLVFISGTNTTPVLYGAYTVTVISSTVFTITASPILTGAGTGGNVAVIAAVGSSFAGVALPYLDIPESIPPKLVSKLAVGSITTGSDTVVTFTDVHYLQVGQLIRFAGTNSTPSLDGTYAVASIPAANEVKLVSPPTITNAGSFAGTGQFIITLVDQPLKLEVAGLYEVFVYEIDIMYTSGEAP